MHHPVGHTLRASSVDELTSGTAERCPGRGIFEKLSDAANHPLAQVAVANRTASADSARSEKAAIGRLLVVEQLDGNGGRTARGRFIQRLPGPADDEIGCVHQRVQTVRCAPEPDRMAKCIRERRRFRKRADNSIHLEPGGQFVEPLHESPENTMRISAANRDEHVRDEWASLPLRRISKAGLERGVPRPQQKYCVTRGRTIVSFLRANRAIDEHVSRGRRVRQIIEHHDRQTDGSKRLEILASRAIGIDDHEARLALPSGVKRLLEISSSPKAVELKGQRNELVSGQGRFRADDLERRGQEGDLHGTRGERMGQRRRSLQMAEADARAGIDAKQRPIGHQRITRITSNASANTTPAADPLCAASARSASGDRGCGEGLASVR